MTRQPRKRPRRSAVRRALPAGLADAGFASLATFGVGLAAAQLLDPGKFGVYALFFSGFLAAAIVPNQMIFLPLEIEALTVAAEDRPALLRRSWQIGLPLAAAAAVAAAFLSALAGRSADAAGSAGLIGTMVVATTLSPYQDHIRRTLHLSGRSWQAAAVSVVQAVGVAGAIGLLILLDVPGLTIPFAALALGNIASLITGLTLAGRGGSAPTADMASTATALRRGPWLLVVEAAPAFAGFVVSVLITRLAGPTVLGYAEAARLVAHPLFVGTIGAAAVLVPRAMEAGQQRDRAAARRLTRPYVVLLGVVGLVYAAVTAVDWWGNLFARLLPDAYVVPGLVTASVVGYAVVMASVPLRSELLGADAERPVAAVATMGALLQVATVFSVTAIGAFARPVSQTVYGLAVGLGHGAQTRALHRRPSADQCAGESTDHVAVDPP